MTIQKHTAIELSNTVEIPWNQLRKDDANVRMVRPIESVDGTGVYGVHAGGRRWSAIGVNVKNGVLSKTFPVPCR